MAFSYGQGHPITIEGEGTQYKSVNLTRQNTHSGTNLSTFRVQDSGFGKGTHVGGEEAADKADGAGAAVEELVRVVQLDTRLQGKCVCERKREMQEVCVREIGREGKREREREREYLYVCVREKESQRKWYVCV